MRYIAMSERDFGTRSRDQLDRTVGMFDSLINDAKSVLAIILTIGGFFAVALSFLARNNSEALDGFVSAAPFFVSLAFLIISLVAALLIYSFSRLMTRRLNHVVFLPTQDFPGVVSGGFESI